MYTFLDLQNLGNGRHDIEEPKVCNVYLGRYFPHFCIVSLLFYHHFHHYHHQFWQEPQSAPPAIKDFANSDPKLRRSYVERQHVYMPVIFKMKLIFNCRILVCLYEMINFDAKILFSCRNVLMSLSIV